MRPYVSYPVVKLSESAAVKFVYTEYLNSCKPVRENSLKNLIRTGASGELSAKNQKRIKELIINLHTAINAKRIKKKFRDKIFSKPLSFITLTLSQEQKHDDRFIKRHMLDRFIIVMRENGFLKNYIWKAETQKNGNIHFHLVTDSFIHFSFVKTVWNNIQRQRGYLDHYFGKFGSYDAPSTEIKACKSVGKTAGYAAKYVAKSNDGRKISGRVWGCSDNVRELKSGIFYCENEYTEALETGVKKGLLKKKEFEFGHIYIGNIRNYLLENCPALFEKYVLSIIESWNSLSDKEREPEPEERKEETYNKYKYQKPQLQLF